MIVNVELTPDQRKGPSASQGQSTEELRPPVTRSGV